MGSVRSNTHASTPTRQGTEVRCDLLRQQEAKGMYKRRAQHVVGLRSIAALVTLTMGCASMVDVDAGDGSPLAMDVTLGTADADAEASTSRDAMDASNPLDADEAGACEDRDRDGHRAMHCGGDDCDDNNADRSPGLDETCDGIDNDCDGAPDNGECVDSRSATTGYGTCSARSECVLSRCVAGRADCDAVSRNGCETQTDTDAANCGACGVRCRFGACVAGRCEDTVEQLASAGFASCARYRSGGVACWGTSTAFGAGTSATTQALPVSVAGVSDAAELSAGNGFFCVRRASGVVACWGHNESGQLGDGSSVSFRATPAAVMGVANAVEIAAGDNGACARLTDGTVRCWGSNSFGEVGDGSVSATVRVPVEVMGVRDAVEVTHGWLHACVRLRSGAVQCWGANASGQLGDNSQGAPRRTPVTVVGLADAEEITAGTSHTCARRRTGAIVCWGSNGSGELGTGTRGTNSTVPTEVAGVTDMAQLVASYSYTCARSVSGAVFCWGLNDAGQCGTEIRADEHLLPAPVSEITDAVEITAGTRSACARLRSGRIRCWGDNNAGQHGYGFVGPARPRPVTVFDLADVTQISTRSGHGCARRSGGTVSCWGRNGSGAVGDDRIDRSFARPVEVLGLRDVEEVSVGGAHTCARLLSGSVVCWGSNGRKQLGTSELIPQSSTPRSVDGLTNVVEISAGSTHTCARDASGAVWCWGENSVGQLGAGTTGADRALATRVVGLDDAVELASGTAFSCARRAGGGVSCWGEVSFGGLGDGTNARRSSPVAVDGLTDAVSLTAGSSHACARRRSGELACWGSNLHRQLGDGSSESSQLSPVSVVGGRDVIAVSAGSLHTCALRPNATVACWGRNSSGEAGAVPLMDMAPLPAPVAGVADVTALSAGNACACALRRDRTIACWGNNSFGRLGAGTVSPPVEL